MVRPGRGVGAAELGGGLPCLPTPFPLLLLAPRCQGGVPAPHVVPRAQGITGRSLHRPMAAQEWQGEGSRDSSGGQNWLVLGLPEARGVKRGCPHGATQRKARTGCGTWRGTMSSCMGWG